MRIGVLAAMDKEVALLRPLLENIEETEFEGRLAYVGRIGEHEVCVLKCGIGKVNSALNTFRLIEGFQPDLVINSGVAGGADGTMRIGTVLVAEEAAYHDVWCGPGTEPGQMDGMPRRMPMDSRTLDICRRLESADTVRYGLICTGDKFISTAEEVAHIKSLYPDALACDMESASIAQACIDSKVPFAVIRVVSDTPGQAENLSQYKNFFSEAPEKTFRVISSIIRNL